MIERLKPFSVRIPKIQNALQIILGISIMKKIFQNINTHIHMCMQSYTHTHTQNETPLIPNQI